MARSYFCALQTCNGKGRPRYAKHRGERASQGAFSTQFHQRTLPFVLRELDGRDY